MFKAICRWSDGHSDSRLFKNERDALAWIIRIKAWSVRKALSDPAAEILLIEQESKNEDWYF